MKISLVTYFYNDAIKYIDTFLSALSKQTVQNFDLIVFNDSVEKPETYFTDYKRSIKFIAVSGTPTQVRFQSFEYLNKSDTDYIIFQDIDDSMSENRVEVLSHLLNEYDIVSNDLSLMNDSGELYQASIWSDKLKDLFTFEYNFIKDKNIVGIGNSAIKKTILKHSLKYSAIPKVADWFMFYQLMYNGKLTAVFTTKCQTLYRQHPNNMAGVRSLDNKRLLYVMEVKKFHYLGLKEANFNVEKELKELEAIEKKISETHTTNPNTENLFWWDETNHLIIN